MTETWSEADSRQFLDLAEVAIPGRREQMDVLMSLLPAVPSEEFRFAELGCGEGLLASRVLEAFPRSRYVGFDGSEMMIESATARLAPFAGRTDVRPFDLHDMRWTADLPANLRCVYASLALHHLPDTDKRVAFGAIAKRLTSGGALLLADIVAAPNPTVRLSWAATWDAVMRAQSLEMTGSLAAYADADREGWNCRGLPEPEPGEFYADLAEQLTWPQEAGFSRVGCFWQRAGIAIYGGYR